jgi:hypothetical protein
MWALSAKAEKINKISAETSDLGRDLIDGREAPDGVESLIKDILIMENTINPLKYNFYIAPVAQ